MSLFSRHRAEVVEMRPKPTLVISSTPDNVTDLRSEFKARERRGRIDRIVESADVIGVIARATSDIEVRDEGVDRHGRAVDYRRRRAATFALGLIVTVGGAFLLGQASGKEDSAPVAPTQSPAPTCEFSSETFNFVPKEGQGWMVAIQQTEGAMDDAACYAQELNYLQEQYGEQPQLNLNLTPYRDGYPIPEQVHRATTTTEAS